jgi:hypothetical protein
MIFALFGAVTSGDSWTSVSIGFGFRFGRMVVTCLIDIIAYTLNSQIEHTSEPRRL